MSKVGRNDPCPCGSGKKFKKCCEKRMIKGKFLASKIESKDLAKSSGIASFFQRKITEQSPSTLSGRKITVKEKEKAKEQEPQDQEKTETKSDQNESGS